MPVVIRKKPQLDTTRTAEAVKHVGNAAPPLKMNESEFAATVASDRQTLKDAMDRPTTASLLRITVRTLDRWHDQDYGPRRKRKFGRYIYTKGEVETWIAEHGRGSHRPRSLRKRFTASSPEAGLANSLVP